MFTEVEPDLSEGDAQGCGCLTCRQVYNDVPNGLPSLHRARCFRAMGPSAAWRAQALKHMSKIRTCAASQQLWNQDLDGGEGKACGLSMSWRKHSDVAQEFQAKVVWH